MRTFPPCARAIAFLLAHPAVDALFRAGEFGMPAPEPAFVPPRLEGCTPQPIAGRIRSQLRYSKGAAWLCEADGGATAVLVFLEWGPGQISPFAGVHRPETCMVAAGATLVSGPIAEDWGEGGTWDSYTFRLGNRPIHVFRKLADLRRGNPIAPLPGYAGRISHALRLERIVRRTLTQCTVAGADSAEGGRAIAKAVLGIPGETR